MTGIERLRQMAEDFKSVKTAEHCTFIVNTWRGRYIDDAIADIADQIERETQQRNDHADVTSCDAYDLLPPDEREAISWVREHGGLDAVKVTDNVRLNYRDALNGVCKRLGLTDGTGMPDMPEVIWTELDRRLMPEGMEWLVEAWPRFEDDAPVRFSDDFKRYGEENGVSAVTMYSDGSFALNCRAYSMGERVQRPTPKVLDADGVEIRVGDTVWDIYTGERMTVEGITGTGGGYQTCLVTLVSGEQITCDGPRLSHRAPVLAADGRPLREGKTVWYRDHIDPLEVRGILTTESGAQYVKAYNDYEGEVSAPAEDFTHDRPDSWERLEEDAKADPGEYCVTHELSAAYMGGEAEEFAKAEDLVRRARALAERDA